MSLLITICTYEGIVMSADSRTNYFNAGSFYTDYSRKLFVTSNNVGISTCGDAEVNGRPIQLCIEDFIVQNACCDAKAVANNILAYFRKLDSELNITFHVCGYIDGTFCGYRVYTKEEKVLSCSRFFNPCGAVWDGDSYAINRLLNNYYCVGDDGTPGSREAFRQVPWRMFHVEDAVEFVSFMMETAVKMQKFHETNPTIGGPIRILVITRNGARWCGE